MKKIKQLFKNIIWLCNNDLPKHKYEVKITLESKAIDEMVKEEFSKIRK